MHIRKSLSTFICILVTLSDAKAVFSPSEYPKQTAVCGAAKRSPIQEHVEIQLSYVDINPEAETTLLMVHGWPSLWSSWSNQIQEFKGEYHIIAPDLRGFGESTHPGDVRSSGTMGDMVGDLVCILAHARVRSAICLGHDWGSQICYESTRLRPDIFTAVIGLVVPYLPSVGSFVPIKYLLHALPRLAYQTYFDARTSDAIAELDQDILRTIRATLRTVASPPPSGFLESNTSFLAAWNNIEIPPVAFLSAEEEAYFVDQYRIQGFKYNLQFYTTENRFLSWETANTQGNFIINNPVLAIYPKQDPVADWGLVAKLMNSSSFTPNSMTEFLDGAHWVHLEFPDKINAIVRSWLDNLGQEARGVVKRRIGSHGDEL